ncbi:MAG: ShlB/FhaC/HecB family hemolysin secretion/activation protein [Pseudomonadales bacterium]
MSRARLSWRLRTALLLALACGLPGTVAATEQRLPELDPDTIRSRAASSTLAVVATDIDLDGNTALDGVAVAAVTERYRGRPLTDADLQALREELSLLYLQSGYLSSGVVVPDQRIIDGRLRLQAVEGRISTIELTGPTGLREPYIIERVRRRVAEPFNVNELRDVIRLLQRDPNIDRVDAHVEPGVRPGDSVLRMSIQEPPPWTVYLRADNHRSEAIGAERLSAGLVRANLSGHGDRLALEFGLSDGSDAGSASYRIPLNSRDVALALHYVRDDVDVVERPFDDLDITTDTESYGATLHVPLVAGLNHTLELSVGGELVRSRTELGGIPFSLSPGAVDGRSKLSVGMLGLDWLRRSEGEVLALRGTLRHGFDVLDATDARPTPFDPSGTDARFTSFLGQVQWVRRLRDGLDVATKATLQVADDPLMGVEKLAVGGINTVRGYRENLLVRDNGAAASLELRWRPFADRESRALNTLTLIPFVDHGRSWDERDVDTTSLVRDTSDTESITGAGLGLAWQPVEGFDVEVYWADDVDTSFARAADPRRASREEGLQDDGVHFSVSYMRRF